MFANDQWKSIKTLLTLFGYCSCIIFIMIEIWNNGPSVLLVLSGVGLILLAYRKATE